MPTVREQKLADVIIENAASDKGMTAQKMLEKAGYDETTAKATPGRVMKQEGVQEALAERGFTLENAKKVIAQIMLSETAKDRDKLTGADMVLKVVGGYAPEKRITLNANVDMGDEKLQGLRAKYEEELGSNLLDESKPL